MTNIQFEMNDGVHKFRAGKPVLRDKTSLNRVLLG